MPCSKLVLDMDIFLFVALIPLTSLPCFVSGQSCEQAHYQRCLTQLIAFTGRKDLLFAPSEQELDHECIQAQSSLGCLTRYSKKCLAGEERAKFMEVIAGPQKLTLGLCGEEAEFKSQYIASLPCLRNMSTGLQYCTEKYDRNQNDIELISYEYKAQLQCCSFQGYRHCLQVLMQTQDGCRETRDVVDEIAYRLGGVLSEDACADYVGRCTGTSKGISLANSVFLLLLSFFVLKLF